MLKCVVKNGLVLAQEIDPEVDTLNLKFTNSYMNMGSENYMILVKNEEQLHKLFPNFKEIARNEEGFVIKE